MPRYTSGAMRRLKSSSASHACRRFSTVDWSRKAVVSGFMNFKARSPTNTTVEIWVSKTSGGRETFGSITSTADHLVREPCRDLSPYVIGWSGSILESVPPTPDPTAAATGGKRLRTAPIIVLWLVAIVTLIVIGQNVDTKESTTDLTYSEFLAKVNSGGVKSASIDPGGKVQGDLTNGDKYKSQIPTAVVGEDL